MILSNILRCREEKKPKEEHRREYITLVPKTETTESEAEEVDDDELEKLDNVVFEDDVEGEPENTAYDDWIRLAERNQKINDIRFYVGLIAIGLAIVSVLVFIGRLIIYPFIRKFAKDYGW